MAHLHSDVNIQGIFLSEMSKILMPYFSLQRYVSKDLSLHFQDIFRHLQAECFEQKILIIKQ